MEKFNITLIFLVLVFVGRGQQERKISFDPTENGVAYIAFGDKIDAEDVINDTELSKTYANLTIADSVQTKFRATVTDVCKVKGCWMKLQLEDGEEAIVRFKDYAFFVPIDIVGREVVVKGQAFVAEMSIEDQKHYAKDGGLSEAEIAKITAPKKTYGFEAVGLLLAPSNL